MLRPLIVWQTDPSGAIVTDRNGDPIPLANPQPKRFEEFTPDDRASWDRQLADDKEWRLRVERRRMEDNIVLTAARLLGDSPERQ